MSVEEAIEILKEIIELHEDNCYLSTEDDFKAIKTLIKAYEKKSKEIEELKENMRKRITYCNDLEKESGEIDEG